MTASATDKRRRLFRAARLAYELGRVDRANQLRREHSRLAVDDRDRLNSEWLGELADSPLSGGEARVRTLTALAKLAGAQGEDQLSEAFIRSAAERCWSRPGGGAGALVASSAEALLGTTASPRRAVVLAFADPVARAGDVLTLIEAMRFDSLDSPARHDLAHAAACSGDFASAEALFAEAIAGYRPQGRLPALAQALVLHAWAALRRGMWGAAVPSAEEGGRLAEETNQPIWTSSALAARAMVEGLRGNVDQAQSLAALADGIATPLRIRIALAVTLVARATAAAGAGEHERAFEHLRRLFDDNDDAHHPVQALWAVGSLCEAATHCGRREEALALLGEARGSAGDSRSPAVRMSLAYATFILAEPGQMDAAFSALPSAELADWPFERNRASLAYGSWLRRQHRVRESRGHLRRARDGFDHLGAQPWASLARSELRASGEGSPSMPSDVTDGLSPQELQIARMAAGGQTNREIGEKLFLSHRTVGSHLYRLFPKLGITSRAQLAGLQLDDPGEALP